MSRTGHGGGVVEVLLVVVGDPGVDVEVGERLEDAAHALPVVDVLVLDLDVQLQRRTLRPGLDVPRLDVLDLIKARILF